MERYFFDVVSHSRSEYDYSGREFASAEQATRFAELIALDLHLFPQDLVPGSTIIVRDSLGKEFVSKPVDPPVVEPA